jgi:hypothetical protein
VQQTRGATHQDNANLFHFSASHTRQFGFAEQKLWFGMWEERQIEVKGK